MNKQLLRILALGLTLTVGFNQIRAGTWSELVNKLPYFVQGVLFHDLQARGVQEEQRRQVKKSKIDGAALSMVLVPYALGAVSMGIGEYCNYSKGCRIAMGMGIGGIVFTYLMSSLYNGELAGFDNQDGFNFHRTSGSSIIKSNRQ